MFIAALEYRKYIQRQRTPEEKNSKLIALALKAKKLAKSNDPYSVFVRDIERAFNAGEDILDPEIFPKEAIIQFAKENKIENDRKVKEFIELAQPEEWWN